VLAAFVGLAGIGFLFFHTPQSAVGSVIATVVPAYLVGRRLVPTVGWDTTYRLIAVAGTVVALWALVEYVFGWHVFLGFEGTGDVAAWNLIQERGQFTRSEGAFGHSIALGGFLAICLPFVAVARFPSAFRAGMMAIVLAGTVVTFSRGPIIAVWISLIATRIGLRGSLEQSTRRLLNWSIGIVVVVGAPIVLNLLGTVESDFDVSTQYRIDLLDTIGVDVNPVGLADSMQEAADGRTLYRGFFGSIDNAYVQFALLYGWLPVLLLAGAGVAVLVRVLRAGDVQPAHIALVSQLFMLATVAFITQYGFAVWMVVGMCAAASRPVNHRKLPVDGHSARRQLAGRFTVERALQR
jgi:hypothetical protein